MKQIGGSVATLDGVTCSSAATPLVALLRAAHDVEERLDAAFAECGVTGATFGVLRVLAAKQEAVTLTELAGALCCVRSNVTQLVDRLETDGFVKRVSHPEDRRSVRATLTVLGRRRLAAATAAYEALERSVFGSLTAQDRERLVRFLDSID